MNRVNFIIASFLILSSCMTTKEAKLSRNEIRQENVVANQELIKQAVESKRFIIKLDKIYYSRIGMIDLRPQYNYIIVDGRKTIISAAYLGRQYDIKPIAGISMTGETRDYEITNKTSKGLYQVKMKVNNGNSTFDIYLSIDKKGTCNASLSSLMIDYVSYRGHIVPIKDKTDIPLQSEDMI